MSRLRRRARGAPAVETALIIGLVVLIALGAAEWGLGRRDGLSVTAGTREGARVGAAAGDTSNADCVILEATAGAVRNINGAVLGVWVYKSDTSGAVGPKQAYRPAPPTEPALVCGSANWFVIESSWPEAARVNTGANRDWLGGGGGFVPDLLHGVRWVSGSGGG